MLHHLLAEHGDFIGGAGVAQADAPQEAVQLGLGQPVSPLVLNRVLGGNDEEGIGQGVGHAVRGDLELLHTL